MAWSSAGFFATAFGIRLLLPPVPAIVVTTSVIVAITLYSGAEYALGMRHVLAARFARSPLEAVRLGALSLAVPVFYLPALDRPDDPTLAILGLLAAELAAGGLDNSLAQMGFIRSAAPDLARSGIQAVCGAVLLWSLLSGGAPEVARLAAILALGVTVGDLGARFWRHRKAFASAPSASPPSA
jgi:hypothetical protein